MNPTPTDWLIHARLRRNHPKTGVCDECGKKRPTHYAFKRHPEPYTEDISDFRELCPSCHREFDKEWLKPWGHGA